MTKPILQILLIEDNQTDVLLFKEVLGRDTFTSFVLTVAERLDTGLETLHQGTFDLVLLDLGLPDSQGLATFERLHKEFSNLPVVVLSGLADDKLALEAVQAGAQDYLVKGPTSWEIAPRAIRYAIERQHSQTTLRETNAKLQALIQASPVGIVVLDAEGTVKLWSPSNEHIFGWSEAEALGKTLPYIPADKQEEHRQFRQRVLQGEAFTGVETRRQRKDGLPVDISISTAPLRDGQGNIVGILGLTTDITAGKQAEEALRDSEARYRLATLATKDVIWEWTAKTGQLRWTENGQLVFGYAPEEVGPQETWWDDHIHPDDRQGVISRINAAIEGSETIWSEEYRFLLKDGSYAYISDHAYIERDGAGKAIRMVGAMSEITERKQAEEALAEAHRRLSATVAAIPDLMFELDNKGRILDYHAPAREDLYDPSGAFLGKTIEEVLPPDAAGVINKALAQAAIEGGHRGASYELDLPVGRRWYELSIATKPGGSRHDVRFLALARDITERKRAEEAIRESETRYRSLFEDSPISLWEEDFSQVKERLDGLRQAGITDYRAYFRDHPQFVADCASLIKIVDVNKATLELYQAKEKEELLKNLAIVFSTESYDNFAEELMHILEGNTQFEWEGTNRTVKGQRLDISLTWSVVPGHEDDFSRVIVTVTDITERKRAEEEILRRNAELTMLNQIGQALSRLAEPSEILEAIFKGIGQVLDNRNLYIALYDQANQYISFPVYTMHGEPRTGVDRPFSNGITEHVIHTNAPLLIRRDLAETLSQSGIYMIGAQSRSFLAVPLRAGDKVIGVIALQDYERENVYDEHHVELLTTIAAQATVALENARLYNEAQQELAERKRAEEALQQSNELLSMFIKQSPIYAYIKEVTPTESRVVRASENFQDMIGVPGSLMAGKTMEELFPPEFAAKITADDWAVITSGQVLKLDEDLDERYYTTIKFPIAQGDKKLLAGYTIDLTERKRAEKALQESEERFRSLYNNATIGLYRTTPDGRILLCNPAAVQLLGFESFDELSKRNLEEDGFEPDYPRSEFREKLEREGQVTGLESIWTKKDGTHIFVRESATVVRDSQGNIVYYDGTFEDITSHKQAEKALRESEKKFKTLFEIAPVGISVLDREHNVIDTNYALQRITGLQKNELVNGAYRKRTYLRPDGSVMPLDEFASTRALKENLPIFDVETGIVTRDRGVVWTLVSAAPLDVPEAGLVTITQDISERKLSEQTLRHRLAELETLYESGLSLGQLLEPKEIGQKIIDVLAEKLDWYHTTVRLYHPESDSLELLAYNIAGELTDQERQETGERFRVLIARPGDGLCGWALQHGETVRCGDVTRDQRYLETVPGVRSGLYVPIKTGERAVGVISVESEKPAYFSAEDEHLVITLAAQAAVALENIRLFKDLQKSNDDLFRAYDDTIAGWSHALDLRDRETEGHTRRVTTLTEELARAMGIPETNLIHIRRGALLHDIGKMAVPDRILLKPDKLTEEEWIIMREHPVHAYNLLSKIEFLLPALNIPRQHHEWWDGSGYPDGLQGEQIPLEARIFAVIDVYDALTSDRPYRPAWPKDLALQHIRKQAGIHFDPKVVDVFMELIHNR